MKNEIRLALLLLTGLLAIAGCQDGVVGDVTINKAPDTTITGGVPSYEEDEDTALTVFSVEFFWTGSDDDGWVDHFEWRISNNGEDGILSPEDTLGLPWNSTVATDSVFIVSADLDSFINDVDNPSITDPKHFRFWQTHTFFVRSVDNLGAPDPSPADVSFTATTIAPTVTITLPSLQGGNSCVTSARALTFGWEGNDPDEITGEPAAVRYALVNVADVVVPGQDPLPLGACLTKIEYETLNPVAHFRDEDWSEWIPYSAGEDSGRVTTFPVKDFGQSFFFAVQVKDVAGAVTPTFQWGRNVRHVKITQGKFPRLSVTEKFLGIETFVGRGTVKGFEIVAGQPLTYSWLADASHYAGIIEAYRYGWEIQDINDDDDPGWVVPWGKGQAFLSAAPRSFQQGSPNFVVQCRDNSGEISRATYQFEVVQIIPRAQQFDLLVIDDFGLGDTSSEIRFRDLWRFEWEQLLTRVLNFDPAVDYISTGGGGGVNFRLLNRYKAAIWFTMGENTSTSFFSTLRPQPGRVRYNWLEVYQSRVGNLLFCGPAVSLGSIEPPIAALDLPLIYNTEDRPPDGLGCEFQPDGTCIPRGTLRWPYSGWCLESSDFMRPPGQGRAGEEGGGILTSTTVCDYLFRAEVAAPFLVAFPGADGIVEDLTTSKDGLRVPNDQGLPQDTARYKYDWEEFYNRNIVPNRSVTISPRACQIPMFLHVAVRDDVYPDGQKDSNGNDISGEPMVVRGDSICSPRGNFVSPITGATIGLASSVYSPFKQLPGSQDFLWGFHPLAFDTNRVEASLLWIIKENWDIEVTN